jgi:hypothetical protein
MTEVAKIVLEESSKMPVPVLMPDGSVVDAASLLREIGHIVDGMQREWDAIGIALSTTDGEACQ